MDSDSSDNETTTSYDSERNRTNSQSSTSSDDLLALPTKLRPTNSFQKCSFNGPSLDLSSIGFDAATAEHVLESVASQAKSQENGYISVSVTEINLSQNGLYCLPFNLQRFNSLTSLDISENNLENLLASSSSSSSTSFSTFSAELQLSSLTSLIACSNKLSEDSLSKNFGRNFAPNLKVLNLSGNKFQSIPDSVLEMSKLRSLWMGANQIKSLSRNIVKLSNLRTLYLGGNQLTEIPDEVGHLSKLEVLSLCENKITKLPSSIAQLKKLRSLALHMNQLTTLPTEIVKLTSLTELSLRNNPLVVRFVNDFLYNPPSLQELAGRCIKINRIRYSSDSLPECLNQYLENSERCVNPKCKGVYFQCRIEQVKFVDFCGKYRLPLLQYLCSPKCTKSPTKTPQLSDGSDDEATRMRAERKIKRVLLG